MAKPPKHDDEPLSDEERELLAAFRARKAEQQAAAEAAAAEAAATETAIAPAETAVAHEAEIVEPDEGEDLGGAIGGLVRTFGKHLQTEARRNPKVAKRFVKMEREGAKVAGLVLDLLADPKKFDEVADDLETKARRRLDRKG